MTLVWHIVRKDFRRMAGPVAVWLGAVLAATLWLRTRRVGPETADLGVLTNWIRSVGAFASFVAWVAAGGAVVLAGQWILEDRVTGSDSFWLTRPISGRRLLAAKVLGAFSALVVVPALLLLGVLAASGGTAAELFAVVRTHVWWLSASVLVAWSLASLADNLGEFLFAALLAGGLVFAGPHALPPSWLAVLGPSEVVLARETAVMFLPFPVLAAVLVDQFFTRRSWRWWTVLTLLAVAVCGLRLAWRWDLSGLAPDLMQAWLPEAKVAAPAAQPWPALRLSPQAGDASRVWGETGARLPDGTWLAPWGSEGVVRGTDGHRTDVRLTWAPGCGEEAAVQEALAATGGVAARWPLSVTWREPLEPRPEWRTVAFSGAMRLMRLRGAVLAEVPLRENAVDTRGARSLRLVALRREGLLVEEREAMPGATHDFYVLVNRARGTAQPLQVRELGGASLSGLDYRLRVLSTDSVPAEAERAGAVVVKVRFTPEGRFTRWVETSAVASGPAVKP